MFKMVYHIDNARECLYRENIYQLHIACLDAVKDIETCYKLNFINCLNTLFKYKELFDVESGVNITLSYFPKSAGSPLSVYGYNIKGTYYFFYLDSRTIKIPTDDELEEEISNILQC